jgi:MATE family multidrug resistance protein
MNAILRGMKDTFIPMLLGMGSYWIIGISSGYFLTFVIHWDGIGLWWGLALGIAASGLILYLRYYFSHQRR